MSDPEYVRFQAAGVRAYVMSCVSDVTPNARETSQVCSKTVSSRNNEESHVSAVLLRCIAAAAGQTVNR